MKKIGWFFSLIFLLLSRNEVDSAISNLTKPGFHQLGIVEASGMVNASRGGLADEEVQARQLCRQICHNHCETLGVTHCRNTCFRRCFVGDESVAMENAAENSTSKHTE